MRNNALTSNPNMITDAQPVRFIEQCKSYFGVPYHPSYHKDPSSPHHNAPLYLDCCGLTRRVMQDLCEDFGFVIGPGNQAYQFETCPVEVEEKDLKPGDLIFTEGTFFKEGKKPQKHNMVHIEVFLGGGESGLRTIGARRQAGVVEIHDHYKFESKSYKITKQFLRSLDTWLDGKCEPLIDPEYWKVKFANSSKHSSCDIPGGKSVFDACDDDDDAGDVVFEEGKKYFYVNKSNGYKLVTDSLEKQGYTRLPFEYNFSTKFDLKWVEGRSAINFAKHEDGQLVNHIPNNDVITNKIGLLTTLQESQGGSFPPPFFPMTYRLDRPSDVLRLLEKIENKSIESDYWIYKPAAKNCGKGIQVLKSDGVKDLITKKEADGSEGSTEGGEEAGGAVNVGNIENKAKPENVEEASEAAIQSRYTNLNLEKGLVQSYVKKPLLLNGKKFDVRVYGLISRCSTSANSIYYHPGYVRLSLEDFSLDDSKLDDKFVHLTNASIQKKHEAYKERKDETIWSMEMLAEYLVKEGKYETCSACLQDLNDKFMNTMNVVYKAAKPKFIKKSGFFDLLGFDFMITEDMHSMLLEVNTNPALHLDCKVMEDVIPKVVDDSLALVLEGNGPEGLARTGKDCLDKVKGSNFVLVNDDVGSGYDWAVRVGVGSALVAAKALSK